MPGALIEDWQRIPVINPQCVTNCLSLKAPSLKEWSPDASCGAGSCKEIKRAEGVVAGRGAAYIVC